MKDFKLNGNTGNLFFSGINFGFRLTNNLLIFSILARCLSMDLFGVTSLLILSVFLSYTFIDFGHRTIVVRDVAINKKVATVLYISNKVATKFPIFLVCFIIAVIYFASKDFWELKPLIIMLFFSSSFFISLSNLNFSFFHSLDKYYLETISLSFFSFFLISGVGLTYFFNDIHCFLVSYCIGSLTMFLCSVLYLKKHFNISLKNYFSGWSVTKVKKDIILSIPFALIFYSDAIFGGFDSFFIEGYFSKHDLGIYEGIKKIITGLSVLALVAMTAVMPSISRLSKQRNKRSFYKLVIIFLLLLFIGILVFFFYYYWNELFVDILLGKGFEEITTWDTHIGIYTLSRYVRIVPAVFLVMGGLHYRRLFIVQTMLWIGLYIFIVNVPLYNMKYAFKMITYVNMALAVLYTMFFAEGLWRTYFRNVVPQC